MADRGRAEPEREGRLPLPEPPALLFAALVAASAALGTFRPAVAQETIPELAAECSAGGDALLATYCTESALRARSARGAAAFLSSAGVEMPGSAGTLGIRLGGVPRLSLGARLSGSSVSHAGLRATDPLPGGPAPEADFFATALSLTGAVGVFDGLSPLPTVGGLLSVDLLGTGSLVLLPDDRGFRSDEGVFGIGARVGLLRESFTLPGVTVSATRRWGGERILERPDGDRSAAWDLTVTSLRGTVGKDLLGVGVLLGAGWDRYEGPLSISIPPAAGGSGTTWDATSDDFVDERLHVYGGAALDFLVLQLSAEAGWVDGYDPVAGREPGGYDPQSGSWYGSLGARLTY